MHIKLNFTRSSFSYLKTVKLRLDQQWRCMPCSINKQLEKPTTVMYLFQFAQIMFPTLYRRYCCQDAVDERLQEMTVSFGVSLTFFAYLVTFLDFIKETSSKSSIYVLSSYFVICCFSYYSNFPRPLKTPKVMVTKLSEILGTS